MKRLLFLFAFILLSNNSRALTITDTIEFNDKLAQRNNFTFDFMERGYNPITDTISLVTLTYDLKEIVEDPFEDTYDSPDDIREFIMIYDRFLFIRGVFPDVDTGVESWSVDWTPTQECRFWGVNEFGEEQCAFKPDQDGQFYSFWDVYTDNLWMNSISMAIEVTRTEVDEPPIWLLLMTFVPALLFRFRKIPT